MIKEEVNAAKDTIHGEAVWELVKNADKVIVTSGKKIMEFSPEDDKDELLLKIQGKTGNLRAPTAKIDNVFYVGYNDQLYNEIIV